MSKVLDLSAFVEETLDIKMPDGSVLNIPKPTQRMVIAVLALREKAENKQGSEGLVDAMNGLVLNILNSNSNGTKFVKADVDGMPLNMKSAILRAYTEYITGVQSDPNS